MIVLLKPFHSMVDGRTNCKQRRIDGRGRNRNKCFLPPVSHVRNEGAYYNLEPRVSPGDVRNAQQSAVAGRDKTKMF